MKEDHVSYLFKDARINTAVLSVFIDLRYAECLCLYYGLRVSSQTNKLIIKAFWRSHQNLQTERGLVFHCQL